MGSCEAVCDISDRFFSLIFQNEIQAFPLPNLLNTGLTIIEIGLFYGGEHLGAKICRSPDFQDGDFCSVLNRERWHVKTLQILVEFF